MHAADFEKRLELIIRNAPEKVDASPVLIRNLAAHLINEDLFPCLAFGRAGAIADIVATDDEHARVWPLFEEAGQSAHKDMIAAVRL